MRKVHIWFVLNLDFKYKHFNYKVGCFKGGCKGNRNNFVNKELCQKECRKLQGL